MDKSEFDLYVVRGFFSAATCRELIIDMNRSASGPALTYGGGKAKVDERVRRVNRVSVSRESIALVAQRLEAERTAMASHFGITLSNFEEPQFLSYRVGDFFVAHQDGNTGLINFDSDRTRRISVTIFLNSQSVEPEPGTYSGGSLVFSNWRTGSRHKVVGEAGMLVAFRSELTHEIRQVTQGERFVVVSWFGTNRP